MVGEMTELGGISHNHSIPTSSNITIRFSTLFNTINRINMIGLTCDRSFRVPTVRFDNKLLQFQTDGPNLALKDARFILQMYQHLDSASSWKRRGACLYRCPARLFTDFVRFCTSEAGWKYQGWRLAYLCETVPGWLKLAKSCKEPPMSEW